MDKLHSRFARQLFHAVLAVAFFPVSSVLHADGSERVRPNVLFLSIDDLRPDLGAYGVEHMITPHLDRLAAQSRIFTRHYVQAPTCGASRYALLTGLYGPSDNAALMQRAILPTTERKPTLPEAFRAAGYTTVAIGKISHHPGGLGGENWADSHMVEMPEAWDRQPMPTGAWQHPEGVMHGLARGEIRGTNPQYPGLEAVEGGDELYPDGLITGAALHELRQLASEERPFFLAVGWIRPHLPFGMPKRYYDLYEQTVLPSIAHPEKPEGRTTWHKSGEFFRYFHDGQNPSDDAAYADKVRRHYAACVSYIDEQVGQVLAELKRLSLDQNTIVVVWGDHGFHLGEHAVWGKHTLFEESLRAPLIIRAPDLPSPGAASAAVVETIDIYPTLCELTGITTPDFLHGASLRSQLETPDATGRVAVAYYAGAVTLRTDRYRLIHHRATQDEGSFFELYDHQSAAAETRNVSDTHPELVETLAAQLADRLALRKGGD